LVYGLGGGRFSGGWGSFGWRKVHGGGKGRGQRTRFLGNMGKEEVSRETFCLIRKGRFSAFAGKWVEGPIRIWGPGQLEKPIKKKALLWGRTG